jgi:hypothetical protein
MGNITWPGMVAQIRKERMIGLENGGDIIKENPL